MLWLHCDDDIEMQYLRTIGERMIEIDEDRRKRHAQMIVAELAKALGSGKRSKGNNSSSTH